MAFEVVAINPRSSGKAKKKGSKMPAKKKKTTKKRRKNPGKAKAVAKRVYSRARETIAGMNIKKALGNTIPHVAGALAAKWTVKKFPGTEGGSDREDWTWGNYLAGGFGGFVAGAIAENIKRGSGQMVLEGALTLLGYKLFINEVAYKNEFLTEQFGQDDEPEVILGDVDAEPGDLLLGDDGEIYMLGPDGYTRPVGEQHRQLAAEMNRRALAAQAMGDALQPVGRTLGDDLRPVGRTLGAVPNDPYARLYEASRW